MSQRAINTWLVTNVLEGDTDMKTIPLTRGKIALVDNEWFEYLNQWKWFCDAQGYACRWIYSGPKGNRVKTLVRMHRVVLGVQPGEYTDHINRNRTDNQHHNLRVCSIGENNLNTKIRSNNKSGYRGVSYKRKNKKWCAQIAIKKRKIHIGLFLTSKEAAMAYNQAATEHFGEFASLNLV
jgi:AP2 domain